MSQKVLLVDDEPNVLRGFQRHLRKQFDIKLAIGAGEALDAIRNEGPFAVVVSDMQMPEVSGVELLSRICDISPKTVRMMLTGNADQKTAVDAVNEGNIFRFLNKPCPPEQLAKAIEAGLEQYRLVTAEADLLNNTLSGSVRMLTQVLSLAMPTAFGRTQDSRRLASELAKRIGVGPIWQIEMAAMLMHIGCVSLPPELLDRYLADHSLSDEESALIAQAKLAGRDLIVSIPRLEVIAEIIGKQADPPSDETPIASRILKVVGDYQRFIVRRTPEKALERMSNDSLYDQEIVALLTEIAAQPKDIIDVNVTELRVGMLLESHVEDCEGRILVAAGNEVHEAMLQKLQMIRRSASGVREPIRVRMTSAKNETAVATE